MEKKYQAEYKYVGPAPLPEGCENRSHLTCSSPVSCFPDTLLETLGYETKHGLTSYFRKDTEDGTTDQLQKYIDAGCVCRRNSTIVLNIDSDNPEHLECVYLELPYKAIDAPSDRPTATERISDAMNTQSSAVVELHCIFEDGCERYLDIPLNTRGPGAISMLDLLDDFELEDFLASCIEKGDMGIRYLDGEDNLHNGFELVVFDSRGWDIWYTVESMSDFCRSIVSTRLVNLENTILPK